MAEAAGRAYPGPWYLRGGRAAGAALTGAAVGAGVAAIWRAGWVAEGNACRGAGDAFCVPMAPFAAELGSCVLICAGVFTGFLLLRVRPKRLTVPVGCFLAGTLIVAVGTGVPGGGPPAGWAAALAAGAGLASLALLADSGMMRVAGFAATAVVIAGAYTIPHLVYSRAEQDARERQLAALRVPLMLPAAAGYHASSAYADSGGLSVSMSPDASGGSSLPAFTVTITPANSTPAEPRPGGKPVECGYIPPHPGCRELKPQAATHLRPATAATLASLSP